MNSWSDCTTTTAFFSPLSLCPCGDLVKSLPSFHSFLPSMKSPATTTAAALRKSNTRSGPECSSDKWSFPKLERRSATNCEKLTEWNNKYNTLKACNLMTKKRWSKVSWIVFQSRNLRALYFGEQKEEYMLSCDFFPCYVLDESLSCGWGFHHLSQLHTNMQIKFDHQKYIWSWL